MSDASTVRGSTPWERAIQHITQVLIVAAIIGGFTQLSSLQKSTAIIETEMRGMRQRFDDFKVFMGDRYTSGDATRDRIIIDRELSDHEDRIRNIERKRSQEGG